MSTWSRWQATLLVRFVCCIGVLLSSATSADTAHMQRYLVTTETGMPNLQANLRYATRQEEHCLSKRQLAVAFWILDHVSLQHCALVQLSETRNSADYSLRCEGGNGTTGNSHWQFNDQVSNGTLRVQLGGKNMTFYQRIVAKTLGACD